MVPGHREAACVRSFIQDATQEALRFLRHSVNQHLVLLLHATTPLTLHVRAADSVFRGQWFQAIEKLRAFATQKNIHVTLVIHPRKEADDVEIGVSSGV